MIVLMHILTAIIVCACIAVIASMRTVIKVCYKKLCIALLCVAALCSIVINGYASLLSQDVKVLKAELVDSKNEVSIVSALLGATFNDAAPPRGVDGIYYDIALPKELQLYTYQCCNYFGIDYEIFLSLMYVESRYDINANNSDKYVGLVQMSVANVEYIEKALSLDIDIYNPYDNILAGTYWLSIYSTKYPDDLCMQLQCYNMGEAGAKNNKNDTTYYNKILSYYLNNLIS